MKQADFIAEVKERLPLSFATAGFVDEGNYLGYQIHMKIWFKGSLEDIPFAEQPDSAIMWIALNSDSMRRLQGSIMIATEGDYTSNCRKAMATAWGDLFSQIKQTYD